MNKDKLLKEFVEKNTQGLIYLCDKDIKNQWEACEAHLKIIADSWLTSAFNQLENKVREEENQAWLDGRRCNNCGKEILPSPTTNTCANCW